MEFNTTEEIIQDIAAGKMVILLDDEDRENEGDLVCAAELVDDKKINRFGTFELGADFSNSSSATMHYLSDVSTTYSISQGVDSNYLATSEFGLTYDVKDNLKVLSSYKRIQGNNSEHTDILKFSFNFKSLRETEYAVIMDATEYLSAGLNIGKNINGIDLDFKANQSFIKNSKKQANIKLSKKF